MEEWSEDRYAGSVGDIPIHPETWREKHFRNFFISKKISWPEEEPTFDVSIKPLWDKTEGLTVPADWRDIELWTRRSFRYPCLSLAHTKLGEKGDPNNNWGVYLANGMSGATTKIGFTGWYTDAGDLARFYCDKEPNHQAIMGLKDVMPGDSATEYHFYSIKVNRMNAELYIDGDLTAIALMGVPLNMAPDTWPWDDTEPYALRWSPVGGVAEWTAMIECSYYGGKSYTFPVGYNDFIVTSGQPAPPRAYQVYNENSSTEWDGLDTGGDKQTSHPIPIWGYPNKTLYFKSDASGTLDIEVYVGAGWEVYDSISPSADELENYIFSQEMQAPIMRLVYTPTDDDTINLAEVHLAG